MSSLLEKLVSCLRPKPPLTHKEMTELARTLPERQEAARLASIEWQKQTAAAWVEKRFPGWKAELAVKLRKGYSSNICIDYSSAPCGVHSSRQVDAANAYGNPLGFWFHGEAYHMSMHLLSKAPNE